MNTRRLFIYSALLAFLITGTALAGRYQRTKDGKTLVWNEDPARGDLVTWSGAQDKKGYATGYGTLTWYKPEKETLIGSFIARPRHYTVSSSISGTMVHGKFEEAPPPATSKTKGRASTAAQQPKAPSPRIEVTPREPQSTPPPERAASPTRTPSPANDSLDSLMHVPSSLKLSSPPATSPLPATPSPSGTQDISLQVTPTASASPSPQ